MTGQELTPEDLRRLRAQRYAAAVKPPSNDTAASVQADAKPLPVVQPLPKVGDEGHPSKKKRLENDNSNTPTNSNPIVTIPQSTRLANPTVGAPKSLTPKAAVPVVSKPIPTPQKVSKPQTPDLKRLISFLFEYDRPVDAQNWSNMEPRPLVEAVWKMKSVRIPDWELLQYLFGCFNRLDTNAVKNEKKLFEVAGEQLTNALIDRLWEERARDIWSDVEDDLSYFLTLLEERRVSSTVTQHLTKALDKAFESPSTSTKVVALAKRLVKNSFSRVKDANLSDRYKLEARLATVQTVMKLSKMMGATLADILEEETNKQDIIKTSCIAHVLGVGLLEYPASPAQRETFTSIANYPQCTVHEIKAVYENVRRSLSFAVDALHQAFLQILRGGKKDALCAWIDAAVEACAKVGVKSRRRDPVGPNFAMNLTALLVKMAKKLQESKLAIQHEYVYSAKGLHLRQSRPIVKAVPETLPASDQSIKYTFATEIFYLTQRAIHLCLIPRITDFREISQSLPYQYPDPKQLQTEATLLTDLFRTQVLDPEILDDLFSFFGLELKYLEPVFAAGASQSNPLAYWPEYTIMDQGLVWQTVARVDKLAAEKLYMSWNEWVNFSVLCLQHLELFARPIVPAKLVMSLDATLESAERGIGGRSGGVGDLSISGQFFNNRKVQTELPFAMLTVFISIDMMEGADIDKEDDAINEASVRQSVALLIKHLFSLPDVRHNIFPAMSASPLYADFTTKLMKHLLHFFEDLLLRVGNIRQIEVNQDAAGKKEVDDPKLKHFMASETRSASGVVQLVDVMLDVHEILCANEATRKGFVDGELVRRHASIWIKFVNGLAGPKKDALKIKAAKQMRLEPKNMVASVGRILARVGGCEGVVEALVDEPDYDPAIMDKFTNILERVQVDGGTIDGVRHLTRAVNAARSSLTQVQPSTAYTISPTLSSLLEWDDAILAEIHKATISELGQVNECDMTSPNGTYLHACHSLIEAEVDARAPKNKALLKELTKLKKTDMLPCHPYSTVCFWHQEGRVDVVRVAVTGPKDTPYEMGVFVFDCYAPGSYPMVPPVVKIVTTGNGTVRFNPNLYNDGKVCLSLLGTWHGKDESEKWNPQTSSLYQVFVSIQALILIEQPIVNEPGYETFAGTNEGKRKSKLYNEEIRLNTLRHAVVGQLRSPPAGCEAFIRQHFECVAGPVMKTALRWRDESEPGNRGRFEAVLREVEGELSKLVE
ncbi:hypothetical protein HDV00_004255 [Rhizophlyctis rosea]|nr:hypothetical protein HDV00_004255 [Rhizophlyctis rosea]